VFQKKYIKLKNLYSCYRFFKQLLLLNLLLACSTTVFASQDDLFSQNNQLEAKQLIQAVMARNASIEAMQSAWQAAKNRVAQVFALDDPILSYSFAPETRNVDGLDFGQKFQLSQKLPWPGKLNLKSDSTRFKAQASWNNINIVRLHLIEASALSFANWYYIHEASRINTINKILWREFKSIAEVRYSAGRATKQDALRAEVELSMLEHQTIVITRKTRNILAQLNTLLNRAPDTPLPPPAPISLHQELPDISYLRSLALSNHPSLKKLIAQQHASDSLVLLAEREYYPDFTVSVAYNSLWNQQPKRFTLGVGINIPLAQDKRKSRVNEQRALVTQIKWQITDKQAQIVGAVQRSYNRLEESTHVLTLYQNKLLPLADENMQASKADYQSGKGNFLNLVSAEKNLIQTQLSFVQEQAQYYRFLAMLASRVGDPQILDSALKLSSEQQNMIIGDQR